MKTVRRILPVIFLFITMVSWSEAASVLLEGEALDYAGDTLKFYTYGDLISYRAIPLVNIPVQEDGTFQGSFDLQEPREIFATPGIYQAFLFAQPGHHYSLVLPPRKEKEIKDILNPYFKPTQVHLGISKVGHDDLNLLIDQFDQRYLPFFYSYARQVYTNKRNKQLSFFIDSLKQEFRDTGDPFFADYMKARMMTLEIMNVPDRAKILTRYQDFSKDIGYLNPAYMELFNQLFGNFLDYLKRSEYSQQTGKAIMRLNNPDSLVHVVQESLGTNHQFAELVMIKGLYDGIYNATYSKKKLLALLEKTENETPYVPHRTIISNLIQNIRFLEPGSIPPPFRLPDIHNRLHTLADFKGKFVYLNFSSRVSYSSLRQFPLLQQLEEKYHDTLTIVTIAPEDNLEALTKLIHTQHYSWIFLWCDPSCTTPKDYKIKVYPTYLLLGPDGKVIRFPAPLPTENFEQVFQQYLNRSEAQ